mmetsp:Transcript_3121/g.4819  ORF Transcript_3121/g.4819 Transcript_3121/m.4819 type:complete len:1294 (+) Transcript_3121:46-3927(+)
MMILTPLYTPLIALCITIAASEEIYLDSLNSQTGFSMENSIKYQNGYTGESVSMAGDVNGDGYDDVLVGSPQCFTSSYCYSSGRAYLIWGSPGGYSDLDLSNLQSNQGITISGATFGDSLGDSVGGGGDINNDGFDDIIVGTSVGLVYVIYGNHNLQDTDVGTAFDGFVLTAPSSTVAVANAGDVNGDGFDDVLVGVPYADVSVSNAGAAYVLFGRASNSDMILENMETADGLAIYGASSGDSAGYSVSAAGDVNADGYGDIVIGAVKAGDSMDYVGYAYVVFGMPPQNVENVYLAQLTMPVGYTIYGDESESNWCGYNVNSAGDINGDGFSDVMVNCWGGAEVFVFYGKSSGFGDVYLTNVPAEVGFKIYYDYYVETVSGGGADVNNDGFSDMIVSVPMDDGGENNAGTTYIVHGKSSTFADVDLQTLLLGDGVESTIIYGAFVNENTGETVSSAGDFNGDSLEDILIGAPRADNDVPETGIAYVVVVGQTMAPTSTPTPPPTPATVSDKIYATFALEVYNKSSDSSTLCQANGYDSSLCAGNGAENYRLPPEWKILASSEDMRIGDNEGFAAKAYARNDETAFVFAYRGTDGFWDDLWRDDCQLALGEIPLQYDYAIQFTNDVITSNNITASMIGVTGHSLGAFLAQLVTATYGYKGVVFESPGAQRVIDGNDDNYTFPLSAAEAASITTCYNAGPNVVNVASGQHLENVIRTYPPYTFADSYNLQQHRSLGTILLLFNDDGTQFLSADMTDYWELDGDVYNWPFFENNGMSCTVGLENSIDYVDNVFFENYNQNPYYWEAYWDTYMKPTESRLDIINNDYGGIASGDEIAKAGVTIYGDTHSNTFFGTTNYADALYGGVGNDSYFPFGGMDVIYDSGGSNKYTFYSHNMAGTTEINDQDLTGSIYIASIYCYLVNTYLVTGSASPVTYAFFPQFESECYTVNDVDHPLADEAHSSDVALLYVQDNGDLLISYNNNEINDIYRDKILIKSFQSGSNSLGIYFGNKGNNTYVSVGTDAAETFECSSEQESILAGMGGVDKYVFGADRKDCSVVSSNGGTESNVIVVEPVSSSVDTLSPFSSRTSTTTTVTTSFYGLTDCDVLDLSKYAMSSYEDLNYVASTDGAESSLLLLPDGTELTLVATQVFVATLDGYALALYNTTAHCYTTNLTAEGIDVDEMYAAMDYYRDTNAPTITPTSPAHSKSSGGKSSPPKAIFVPLSVVGALVFVAAVIVLGWYILAHQKNGFKSSFTSSNEVVKGAIEVRESTVTNSLHQPPDDESKENVSIACPVNTV